MNNSILASPSVTQCLKFKIPRIVIIILALGLFGTSVFRAATYPFTHDEALSFLIFNGQSYWAASANNHLLNTQLMKAAAALFGNSEISLRLPNILAHGVYLTFGILVCLKISKPVAQIGGFILLNSSLFMLDFFFLARGYGLALGLQMASLFLLIRAVGEQRKTHFLAFAYAAMMTAGLAVYANFTFLNYFIPLWIVVLGLFLTNRQAVLQINRKMLPHLTAAFLGGAVLIASAARLLLDLKAKNELYLGGVNNILSDTLKSLVQASLYTDAIPALLIKPIAAGILALVGLFVVAAIALWVSDRQIHPFHCLLLLFVGAILLPILQNRLFDTHYPVERSALYYLPIFAVMLGLLFDFTITKSPHSLFRTAGTFFSIAASLTLAGYFFLNFNPFSCYSWNYEAANKQVMQQLVDQRNKYFPDQAISVGISWVFEPSLNYYRISRHYTWLQPLTRDPVEPGDPDFIYAFEKDLPVGLESYLQVVKFPAIETILLRKVRD